jgi:hypothetical protein
MTAVRSSSLPPDSSEWKALRRALTAEWTRLWTLRSTWWALLAGSALVLFIGAVAGAGHEGPGAAPIWEAAQVALVPGQFAFAVVALLAATGEYATGAIRSTLQWVPRRGVVLAARILVPVAFGAASAVVVSVAGDVVAWGFLGETAEVVPGDIAASLGKIAVVVAFGGLLSVGLGLFLRSTAGSLAVMFLLMFVLPVALGNVGVPWLTTISDRLPGRAVVSLLVTDETDLSTGTVAAVMSGWTIAALVAGGWSLIRRDTT